ncbi:glutathione S-transferase [Cordyceps javanica]|uniref:Glutathione S-transferase n=1 Tax=Cordyceps javanica TaxID=43265 RepID=A0A545VLC9_9HYPO|nr:glutathione S-transferase [Cordyceps javanica]TQW02514.1 glutathione S-transferase [Cordyceps javanica]
MASPLKPLVLWGVEHGPNPWKVAFALDELAVPYALRIIDFAATKTPPYSDLCVNGRTPALEDPNTGAVLWESGAILEYLLETYDDGDDGDATTRRLSFARGTPDYFLAKQWLHFQASGQGPYFGQAVWFSKYHPERLPSAVERYVDEVRRVTGVLDRALEGKEYLVGGRYSYVDLAFLPWFMIAYFPWYARTQPGTFADQVSLDDFPNVKAWLVRIQQRPVTAKSLENKFATIENLHKENA